MRFYCTLDGAIQDGDLGNDVPEPVAGDIEFQNVVRCIAPQFVFCGILLIGIGIVKFSVTLITCCANIDSAIWMANGIA